VVICGIDEAGRGPLAGPVAAGAVILGDGEGARTLLERNILRDSKALSAVTREELSREIRASAEVWGLGWAWPWEIDRLNIHWASLLAMRRAFWALSLGFRGGSSGPGIGLDDVTVQVDGRFTPSLPVACTPVVGGDRSVPEIQAAAILAKVARDRWMCSYGRLDPRYEFCTHKGYPTAAHRRLIGLNGISPIHRRSFRMGSSA
jgi:ribonuclease HII